MPLTALKSRTRQEHQSKVPSQLPESCIAAPVGGGGVIVAVIVDIDAVTDAAIEAITEVAIENPAIVDPADEQATP